MALTRVLLCSLQTVYGYIILSVLAMHGTEHLMPALVSWFPRLFLAVASIIVAVPWTNVWPRGSVFCALLFDAVVLVAFLLAWGERFAEEGEPL
jgi:hypothetical protein